MSENKDFTKAHQVTISFDRHEQRIDNFLIQYFKRLPKARVYRLVRKGEVRVNGGRIKPDHRLSTGDIVRIPPVKDLFVVSDKIISHRDQDRLNDNILYEDHDLLILNKPVGIAVHGGSKVDYGVIDILKSSGDYREDWRLVHRLDQETSGCLMIAKNMKTLRELQHAFQTDQIQKTYTAILVGHWSYPSVKTVDLALDRCELDGGDRKVRVDEAGKSALSIFHFVKQYKNYCQVNVELKTGRTHQIRVHAQALGLPVLGDQKYGDSRANAIAAKQGLNRMCLHAEKLHFIHPGRGEPIEHVSPFEDEEVIFSFLRAIDG